MKGLGFSGTHSVIFSCLGHASLVLLSGDMDMVDRVYQVDTSDAGGAGQGGGAAGKLRGCWHRPDSGLHWDWDRGFPLLLQDPQLLEEMEAIFLNIYCLEQWGAKGVQGTLAECPVLGQMGTASVRTRFRAVAGQTAVSPRISLSRKGLTFVSVHDCFWTHAADIPVMNEVCPVPAPSSPTSRRWGLDPRNLYHG